MRRFLIISTALAALCLSCSAPFAAKNASPPPAPAAEPPPKVRELLELIGDPQVRAWLDQQKSALPAKAEGEAGSSSPSHADSVGLGEVLARFGQVRTHFNGLKDAIPNVPEEIELALDNFAVEFQHQDLWRMVRLFALFAGLGYGAQRLFRWSVERFRKRLEVMSLDTVGHRLAAVFVRFVFSLGMVASFAVGSIGAFLAFDWPELMKGIVLGYLIAFLAVRLAVSLGHFILAPGTKHFTGVERFRIVPVSTQTAKFWHWRIVFVVGWVAFGWVTVDEFALFGVSEGTRDLIAYALGLVVLAIGIEAVWRSPSGLAPDAQEDVDERHSRHARATGLTFYFALLWLLWVAGAATLFWVAVLAVGVPAAIRVTERSVNHILRPPGHDEAKAGTPPVAVVCLERGLRSLIIVGAIAWLAYVWQVDVGDLASRNTLVDRLLRGGLTAAIVILIADFLWNVAKALIDTRVEEASLTGEVPAQEEHRRARLRTLLPILRNILFIIIIVLAGMMGLSALGVEIGPLIASAGVVGVAIGFGAQTLVRDVISGVFYLLDDAFRVGEYIQSGNYKGVVESFSLRSVKLRHHNGPLYTVPFGVLGAVQNQSRDWVVVKLNIGVTYDTDLDKARKIIKKLGQELAADPELAPGMLQPLKMQGVEAFGDYALQLRMKMMTRPGDVQFMARRRALGMIKKAFDANGIKFAYPTVQVAGSGDEATNIAVAQKGLELVKPAVAE
jgi:moderate conductance mechanosensitive channel